MQQANVVPDWLTRLTWSTTSSANMSSLARLSHCS